MYSKDRTFHHGQDFHYSQLLHFPQGSNEGKVVEVTIRIGNTLTYCFYIYLPRVDGLYLRLS
jgi:hypothetical protein